MSRRKKEPTAEELTTQALLAELKKAEEKKPDQKRQSKPRIKKEPEIKPRRETKALKAERATSLDLVCAAWGDPGSKNLRENQVSGYIRGIMTVERAKAEPDLELLQDLRFLVILRQLMYDNV